MGSESSSARCKVSMATGSASSSHPRTAWTETGSGSRWRRHTAEYRYLRRKGSMSTAMVTVSSSASDDTGCEGDCPGPRHRCGHTRNRCCGRPGAGPAGSCSPTCRCNQRTCRFHRSRGRRPPGRSCCRRSRYRSSRPRRGSDCCSNRRRDPQSATGSGRDRGRTSSGEDSIARSSGPPRRRSATS